MTLSSTFITPGQGETARVGLDSHDRNCIEGRGQSGSQREPHNCWKLPEAQRRQSELHAKQITIDWCGARWM
jgi:hypothetical protein